MASSMFRKYCIKLFLAFCVLAISEANVIKVKLTDDPTATKYDITKRSIKSDANVLHEADKHTKVTRVDYVAELGESIVVKRSINGTANEKSNASSESHDGKNETAHSEGKGHYSIHVASWNFAHVESPLIIAVFLMVAGIAKLGFHHANFLSSKVPESCLLIILGTVVGAILYGALPDADRPGLTSELFFLYLLPPIILESAYSLHDRTFYDNVGTVLIYAVLGTVLNCFMIGPSLFGLHLAGAMGEDMPDLSLIQCLVFSAVIVAVDPVAVLAIFQEVGVNNTLYFLVFGESLLNDAVTVVLYNMMKTFNLMDEVTAGQVTLGVLQFFVVSLGGLAIGILFGALTAIITKYTEHCRVVEPLAVFVLAYISYLAAEMFHFSGIISIIGCGLTQAQYAFHNISKKSFTTVKYFSKMMSATNDCVIFMFLGVALFKEEVLKPSYWHVGFILWALLLCLVYRFVVVFGLTFFLNKSDRVRKMDYEEQFIMAYGGLRGAVAFSLVDVLQQENLPKGHFLISTLMVIFFTVFIQGSTIKPLVKFLRVRMEVHAEPLISEEINIHVTDHVMAGIEEILGKRGEHHFREVLEHYNTHYLKHWLQRDPITADEQIMQYFEQMALEQHFENLAGSKMIRAKYGSDVDTEELISEAGDEESETGSQAGTFILSSTHTSLEDISPEQDFEYLMAQTGQRRRKSFFPVNLDKETETRLIQNPTSEDVRKIMLPTRRQLNYKQLDKNIKGDDSYADLLRFIQSKQFRTKRASNAIWNQPSMDTLQIPADSHMYPRRKSIAANVANNYRRRLSLAEPDPRVRGKSAGNIMKGIDSPARRRLQMHRRTHSEAIDDSPRGSPYMRRLDHHRRHGPGSEDAQSDSMVLGIITEHSEDDSSPHEDNDAVKTAPDPGSQRKSPSSPRRTSPDFSKSAAERRSGRMRRQQRTMDERSPVGARKAEANVHDISVTLPDDTPDSTNL